MARRTPRRVTARAANLRRGGMVNTGFFMGSRFEVKRSPARILPHPRRLIEAITLGAFSLMGARGINRGEPMETKKMRRKL